MTSGVSLITRGDKSLKLYFFSSAKTYETDNREKTTLIRGLFKKL